jgi:hypothetical protein
VSITKDPKRAKRPLAKSGDGKPAALAAGADAPAVAEPASQQKLTPEEQMALFEKELKENDWGHQPC